VVLTQKQKLAKGQTNTLTPSSCVFWSLAQTCSVVCLCTVYMSSSPNSPDIKPHLTRCFAIQVKREIISTVLFSFFFLLLFLRSLSFHFLVSLLFLYNCLFLIFLTYFFLPSSSPFKRKLKARKRTDAYTYWTLWPRGLVWSRPFVCRDRGFESH
jgi:hypothetical protein